MKRIFRKIKLTIILVLGISCFLCWQDIAPSLPTFKEVFEFFGVEERENKNIGPKLSNSNLMSIHVIDVLKADSIYINCENKNILIDASEYETRETVSNYLKKQEVENLDLVIATHPHSDHIGGMAHILKEFGVKEFLMPEIPEKIIPTSKSYELMLKALKEKKIKAKSPTVGEVFEIGNMKVTILAPCKKYEEMNNNSIVLSIEFKNKKFLFTGDAEKESEHDMISKGFDLKSDFLKVGHHGSKTSTSDEFLRKVSPHFAAISTSKNFIKKGKSFDPPAFKKLVNNNVKVLRTDQNGTIIFKTDGENINIDTEK